jgi:hypothetical protein
MSNPKNHDNFTHRQDLRVKLSPERATRLTEIGWQKIATLGVILGLALCLTLASASAQTGGYTIWNSDGSFTVVTPNGRGGDVIWDSNGNYGELNNNGRSNYIYWDSRGNLSTIVPNGNAGSALDPIFDDE